MNSSIKRTAVLAAWIVVFLGLPFYSPAKTSLPDKGDRTLSPYFFVKSNEGDVDRLPLKSTSAAVKISGIIADVEVTQIYKNDGKRPLEAIYVFPASTRAAVHGMKMTIGKRVIMARIARREEARRDYEQARDQGKSASLLEQQRPNVFQMNVANIMPGDEIRVELRYTELLVPTDRVYEFVYPTVVGPRYSNQAAESTPDSERWTQNPYLHQGEQPPYMFDVTVDLSAGLPIKDLKCASHRVSTSFDGPTTATVRLDRSEQYGGNRDYILKYRLDGEKVQSGLLLYRGDRENFFLLTTQAPRRVTRENIPGREYIFIVDVSGSMNGFPLEISKRLLKDLIGGLLPTDRFNVLLFSGGSSVMSERSLPASADNIEKALSLIDRQQGGGGTELLPAFQRALALEKPAGYSRTVIIATDGYVSVEEEVFDLIQRNLGKANLFAFGIGTAVNRHLIEGMARVGMGEPFVITAPSDAAGEADRFRKMIQSPVLTDVRAEFQGFEAYDVEPPSIPDVLAERPVIVFGKWRGRRAGRIILSGASGAGLHREVIDVKEVKPMERNSALAYLWARHRIAKLSDYNQLRVDDRRKEQVTELGLAYQLLTAYTSFVAVDTEIRNGTDRPVTVKQPLPLPEGVSDFAVGQVAPKAAAPAMLRSDLAMEPREERAAKAQELKENEKKRLRIGHMTVPDGIEKKVILEFVQKHEEELLRCWPEGSREAHVLEIVLGPDGRVKAVKIVSGWFKSRTTEECVLGAIGKWKFPPLRAVRDVTVTVTLSVGV